MIVKLRVDAIVNPNFIQVKRWHPIKPTTEEDHFSSFTPMAEALDELINPLICAEPQPLKSCLKAASINLELESSSLVLTTCNNSSCQKFSHKIPTDLPKHVHFRLTSDDSIHAKRPSSFLEFDFEIHLNTRV